MYQNLMDTHVPLNCPEPNSDTQQTPMESTTCFLRHDTSAPFVRFMA